GLVPAAVVDVLPDARQAGGLAGRGVHAGPLRYQFFDTRTRGCGVIEDFDGETVCRQRGGRSLQALRRHRVGEQCGRDRGRHGALLLAGWRLLITSPTTQPGGMSDRTPESQSSPPFRLTG